MMGCEDGEMTADALNSALEAIIGSFAHPSAKVSDLRRLSGGASQETWSFDSVDDSNGAQSTQPLILRRTPGGKPSVRTGTAIPLATEAELIRRARQAGVVVPTVHYVLQEGDGLGEGFIMERIEGETIARKILRDEAYATARKHLAFQCGEALAKIHKIKADDIKMLPSLGPAQQLKTYLELYDSMAEPHPVFELAFRWLADNKPEERTPRLVHGDFRNGNIIVGEDGLRAVLDWELAHLGDPLEDFGWICVNSWRFGQSENPVGGFGSYDELFAGYESAGGDSIDRARVKYWEVFGTLKWGIMCMLMVSAFRTGMDTSVERAAIGRRASETEIDLLNLLAREG